jgi:deoxyribodipyrimidine photolyase-related protein
LDSVVGAVWEDGYSHHITRLMVLSNLAMLLDVSPRELSDWFWVAYVDAYDWVVEPNVHGMGTFGVGDLLTTKPYTAGAAYIDRMSDFCEGCRFDPKKSCPITPLYWAYLGRHRDALARVPRLKLPLAGEAKRSEEQRRQDAQTYEAVAQALDDGQELAPRQGKLF